MKTAGVRELKARLSAYLREVRAGEVILVTDNGRVVAELRAPGTAAAAVEVRYPRLQREGLVTLATRAYAAGDARSPLAREELAPPGTAARLVDEDRGA